MPYSATPSKAENTEAPELPVLDVMHAIDPAGYIPDQGLADAVNTALMLRQPLLLTGEPGTGKTQLATNVAWQLKLPDALIFETKSTSQSRDLFYTFDTLRRFQAAHVEGADLDAREFIEFSALGLAILRTRPWSEVQRVAPERFRHDAPSRHVVLIDEVDKAPRDFPNDVLNELEHLYFRIPELGGDPVRSAPDLRPIVIITSNSEKSLPDAFLRRCVFYHIPFPSEDRLERIILQRVAGLGSGTGLVPDVLDFFGTLREDSAVLRKKPGTAELLNWVTVLVASGIDVAQPLKKQTPVAVRSLSTLAKHPEDQERVVGRFKAWVHE